MHSKVRFICVTAAERTYGFYKALLRKTGHLLFSRVSLIVISIIILSISVDVFRHLYDWALTSSDDLEEMLRETEGISTLFLGIGLILKERRLLEKLFDAGPGYEDWKNNLCLHTGLGLILTGTAMRIAAQLIRIPNRVISTQGKEHYIFAIGLLFCALASLQLLYLTIRLGLGNRQVEKTVRRQ